MRHKLLSIAGALALSFGCSQPDNSLGNLEKNNPTNQNKLKPEASDESSLQGFIACEDSVIAFGMPAASEIAGDNQSRRKNVIRTSCSIRSLRLKGEEVAAASAEISSDDAACQSLLDSADERIRAEVDGSDIDLQLVFYFSEIEELFSEDQCEIKVSAKDSNDNELSDEGKGSFIISKATKERRLTLLAPRQVEVIGSLTGTAPEEGHGGEGGDPVLENYQQLFEIEEVSTSKYYDHNLSDHTEEYECSHDLTDSEDDDPALKYSDLCEDYGISVTHRNGIVSINRYKAQAQLDAEEKDSKEFGVKFVTLETADGFALSTREVKFTIRSAYKTPTIAKVGDSLECSLPMGEDDSISRAYRFESRADEQESYAKVSDGSSVAVASIDVSKQTRCVVTSASESLVSRPYTEIDDLILAKMAEKNYAVADDSQLEQRRALAVMKTRGGETLIEYPMDPRNNTLQGVDNDPSVTRADLALSFPVPNKAGDLQYDRVIQGEAAQWGNTLFIEPAMATRGTADIHGNFGSEDDSARGTWSCGTCHNVEYAYGPTRSISIGAGGLDFADNRTVDPRVDLDSSHDVDAPPVRSPMIGNISANGGAVFHNQRAGGRRDCGDAAVLVEWPEDGLSPFEGQYSEGSRMVDDGLESLEPADGAYFSDGPSRNSAWGAERKCANSQTVEQWATDEGMLRLNLLGFEGIETQAIAAIAEHRFSAVGNVVDKGANADTDKDLAHWAQKRAQAIHAQEIEASYTDANFEAMLAKPAGSLLVGCNSKPTEIATEDGKITEMAKDNLCTLAEIIQCDGSAAEGTPDKQACPTDYLVTLEPGKLDIDPGSGNVVISALNIDFSIRGDKASGLTVDGKRPEDGAEGQQDELINESVEDFKKRIKIALIIAAWERMVVTEEAPFQPYLVQLDKKIIGDATANLEKDLSQKAKRGALVFMENCAGCHNGPDLGGDPSVASNWGLADAHEFFADKEDVPHLAAVGERTLDGRFELTGDSSDKFKKKVSGLYNLQDHVGLGWGGSIDSIEQMVKYKVSVLNDKSKRQKSNEELAAAGISIADYENSMVDVGGGPGQAPQSMADMTPKQIDDVSYFLKVSLHDAGMDRFSNPIPDAAPQDDLQADLMDEDGGAIVDDGTRLNPNPYVCAGNDDTQSRFTLAGADPFGCDGEQKMYQD